MLSQPDFHLDSRLAADTEPVGRLHLSLVRLMNDMTYPWVILVPQRADLREIVDLNPADRLLLMEEIAHVSTGMRVLFEPDKLNVAAIGNLVSQLHIHIVARYTRDAAWPAPVWGRAPAIPYAPDVLAERLGAVRGALNLPQP